MEINGLKVLNGLKPVKITITKTDALRGANKDPAACAAARACLRQDGVDAARVHLSTTYLRKGGKWYRYTTPVSLRSEIVAFDRGGKFEPGDYTLSPKQPSHRATGKRFGGEDKPKRKKRAKIARAYHVTIGVRSHGAAK